MDAEKTIWEKIYELPRRKIKLTESGQEEISLDFKKSQEWFDKMDPKDLNHYANEWFTCDTFRTDGYDILWVFEKGDGDFEPFSEGEVAIVREILNYFNHTLVYAEDEEAQKKGYEEFLKYYDPLVEKFERMYGEEYFTKYRELTGPYATKEGMTLAILSNIRVKHKLLGAPSFKNPFFGFKDAE